VKDIDDVISGPAYDKPPERDPVSQYYERIEEKRRAVWKLREQARELRAPNRVMVALDEWHAASANTGD
jgi:hypothetical protein